MDIPELNISDELLDFDLDVEIPGFELDLADMSAAIQTDFVKIRRYPRVAPSGVLYEKAVDLVKRCLTFKKTRHFFVLLQGILFLATCWKLFWLNETGMLRKFLLQHSA